MHPRWRRPLVPVVLAVVLATGGCADESDETNGDNPPATGESEVATTPDLAELAELAGGAPAAQGAGLDDPPGNPDRVPLGDFGEIAIAITTPDGTTVGWCVLLARSPQQRQRGLMEVTDLQGYDGMVFVYSGDTGNSFFMRNTPMSLSIGWFAADGNLVASEDMEPCADVDGCPLYAPGATYRFALEVPRGGLDELGAEDGSRLSLGGGCAPRT